MTPTLVWYTDIAPHGGLARPLTTRPAGALFAPSGADQCRLGSACAPSTAPQLLLLGPIELSQADGCRPGRAEQSCLEYLAWLIHHRGGSARCMTRDLVVADSTRRSNLCRLRHWLGHDGDGVPYLPTGYSGRLWLSRRVGCDWQTCLARWHQGVAATATEQLIAGLALVRGRPLADARPGQWGWLEPVRLQMNRLIRQAGAELADRALAEHQLDLAEWALGQGGHGGSDDQLQRLTDRLDRLADQSPRFSLWN